MKDYNNFTKKLTFSDILYQPNREVFITLLYDAKKFKKFGIVPSKNVTGTMDETDTYIKSFRCHVSGYDYADIDFEDEEDLNTVVKYDTIDGYSVFSNYQDALDFYNDNI